MEPKTEHTPPQRPSILTQQLGNGKESDTKKKKGKDNATGEGLDRRVEKKMWTRKRLLMLGGGLLFVILVAWGFSTTLGGRKLNVETDKITVAAVERAPFQENISVTGNVLPRTTVYLDAVEGGRIEEIFVLEGTQVEAGQPLLRLSNNDMQLSLINAEAQRIEQINRLQDTRFRMEQNALNLRQQLTDMNYNITRLERQHGRNQELYEKKLISEQEYEQIKDELEFYRNNKNLTLEGFKQDSTRMASEIRQMQSAVQRMEASYQVLQDILDNLVVRAPVSGHLTALDAEIGQLRSSGSRFGQIDVLDGYKVRATIDEFHIARVQRGQEATTLPIAGKTYEMEVKRVYPEVREGRFEADLEFVGETPTGIRRGQTIRFLLEMSDPAEAVLVPRGGFFQSTGGNWVYVVDDSGDYATKRSIRLGRQNTQNYEVLEGLELGERVVTSSYDTFGDADRLVLK